MRKHARMVNIMMLNNLRLIHEVSKNLEIMGFNPSRLLSLRGQFPPAVRTEAPEFLDPGIPDCANSPPRDPGVWCLLLLRQARQVAHGEAREERLGRARTAADTCVIRPTRAVGASRGRG